MRRVHAGRGWQWIKEAWRLIRPRFGLVLGTVLLMYVLLFFASMIPMIGNIIAPILAPFLAGGVYVVLRRVREIEQRSRIEPLASEQPISFDLLFSVFKDPAPRKALLWLGFVSIAFSLALLLVVATFVTVKLSGVDHSMLTDPSANDEQRVRFLIPYLMDPDAWALWIGILIASVAYSMATFFAVPLIVLRGETLRSAFSQSFSAVGRNWSAFLVYALVLFVLFLTVPITLMLSLILLLPLMITSVFIAFEDIWGDSPVGGDADRQDQGRVLQERTSTVM
jgi:hypothetical protein